MGGETTGLTSVASLALVPLVLESNLVSTSSILVKPSLDSEEVMMMGGAAGLGGVGAALTATGILC